MAVATIEEDIDFHDGTVDEDTYTYDDAEEFQYATVDVPSDEDEPVEETFQDALRTVQMQQDKDLPPSVKPVVTRLPEVIDDFVRNFLVKAGLEHTLETFETEWYEKKTQLAASGEGLDNLLVPDVYQQNARTMEELELVKEELKNTKEIAEKGKAAWEKLKKDRDFHRTSHQRVMQEKGRLINDIKRLQTQCSKYEPTILELRHKYESCMKEKMLVRLDRDKLTVKVQALENTIKDFENNKKSDPTPLKKEVSEKKKSTGETPWPAEDRPNPFKGVTFKPPNNCSSWGARQSHKGHAMSVSCIAVHPKTATAATASDDKTWKLWNIPTGELIMSGDDHKDWIASVDFHPRGTHLATASGDKTVKVWDFLKAKCVATYKDHTQGVWRACFHDTGDFLASCSLDHTARIWDLHSNRCRSTLRGHVDSVNGLAWLPFTNTLATCSGDKTVSLWDPRTQYCSHTFYGHENACNSVVFTPSGETMLSTDADGKVYVWDIREVKVMNVYDCGPHPANGLSVDRSSTYAALASDDCTIKLINMVDPKEGIKSLKGHEDSVLGVQFDPMGSFIISCGADTMWKYWG
mmetsp:Transcript_4241/g.7838  ORF Transcript_4241/g.7838 Transcript_4241/m.7838 type:complete len:579 (-) Transcript_4241:1707-3443(-)